MKEAKAEFIFILTIFKFTVSPASGCICKQTTNWIDMKSEFTALQVVISDLTNLKQEFEQTKIFKLNK